MNTVINSLCELKIIIAEPQSWEVASKPLPIFYGIKQLSFLFLKEHVEEHRSLAIKLLGLYA